MASRCFWPPDKRMPPLAYAAVVALRQGRHEVVGVGLVRRPLYGGAAAALHAAVGYVAGDAVVEEDLALRHQGDLGAQVGQAVFLNGHPVQQDGARRRIVESRHQGGEGGFAAAGASHQGHHLPRGDLKVYVLQHPLAIAVGEAEVAALQMAARPAQAAAAAVPARPAGRPD